MADLEKSSEAIEEPAFQAEVDELERETSEEEEEEEETDAVSREKLQALGKSSLSIGRPGKCSRDHFIYYTTGSSSTLKEMLRNEHLRLLLLEIDQSDCPPQALRQALNFPIFQEFRDECLRIITQTN